jgi:hypothetical protein
MKKREGLAKTKKKSNALFELLDDIKWHKTGTLLDDEDSEYYKAFNSFIIFQMLSMNNNNCEILSLINHLQSTLDKKRMYKLLINLIPSQRQFDPFIKASTDTFENEKTIAEYFECSINEARDYIKIMGNEWSADVKTDFGGSLVDSQ